GLPTHLSSFSLIRPPQRSLLFPYTTLFRSGPARERAGAAVLRSRRLAARRRREGRGTARSLAARGPLPIGNGDRTGVMCRIDTRSEEHTSELQSRRDLVCRLLLEKKKESRQ